MARLLGVVLILATGVAAPVIADETSDRQNIEWANAFLRGLGEPVPAEAPVIALRRAGGGAVIEFGAAFIVHVDPLGRVVGFSNGQARGGLMRGGRLEPRVGESRIEDANAATERARQLVALAGLRGFEVAKDGVEMPSSVDPQSRETGMAGVVKVRGGQTAEGFPGYVNTLGIELDGQTGRLLWLTASTRFRFERPKSVLSERQALAAIRRLVAENRDRLAGRGVPSDRLKRWEWPGDGPARNAMKLHIVAGHGTTAQATAWRDEGVARVAWGVFLPQWQALIDAETGAPLGVTATRGVPGPGAPPVHLPPLSNETPDRPMAARPRAAPGSMSGQAPALTTGQVPAPASGSAPGSPLLPVMLGVAALIGLVIGLVWGRRVGRR